MSQNLIRRATWGARYDNGTGPRPLPITEWWLHHSVTIAPDLLPPFDDDDAAVRTLERIGESRFGRGISYTFPVTPVGRIYEGHSMDRVGSHTKGHNTVGAAFVLVGDYTKHAPTAAMELAVAERMVIEHRAGRATRHTLNGGHRDASGNSTACPGDAAHARVGAINAMAERLWSQGTPSRAKPTPRVPPYPGGTSPSRHYSAATLAFQKRLRARGWRIDVDGYHGPQTTAVLRAFQKEKHLTVDGRGGPQTWTALWRLPIT